MLERCIAVCLLAATALVGAAAPVLAAGNAPPAFRGNRVLLVAAPSGTDAALLQQRAVFAALGQGARERDLVMVEAVGPSTVARDLRARFGLAPDAFRAVLIGKDGGVKLRADGVLGAERLFPVIDAMPMRQDEMRRRP